MDPGSWALRNRAVVAAAILVAVLGGLFASTTLPSGIYPEVDFPRIVVVARGGDAPPDVFITSVMRPLEESLVTVLGVRRVRSRTIRGSTEIDLQFVPGTDMWRALQRVESRVNEGRGSLPAGTDIEVERLTPTAFPVVTFNLSGTVDPRALHDLGEFVVRPALARVPGVGQVRVLGGDVREIEIELDPVRAASHRLRPADVALRVRNEVPFQAVGRFERDRQLVTVLATAEAHDVAEIASVPVSVTPGGAPVPLGDIALVREGAVDRTVRVGGPRGETVLVSVSRLEGASTPDVVRGVEQAARDLARSLPPGVVLETVYDQADLVTESLASVRDAILLGIGLCLVVLGISLRNARAGLLAALTVPVTLAITFLCMKALRQSLNLMSLGGMAVAIGLVIDDAIVVIEAIARRLEHGESARDAAAGGTRDMAPAVVGTTLTTVIVFVPLAFVTGLVGDFFRALAITLSAAVLISMVVALVGVPAVASRFLRAAPSRPGKRPLDRVYGSVAAWGARHRWVGVALLALGGVVFVMRRQSKAPVVYGENLSDKTEEAPSEVGLVARLRLLGG
ncbi:MAG: efflux RND transporter permease subunit, partial [Deltaproteobacteria bacterium]